MRTDHPSIPPAAPRHRNPVIAAHYRMAYRFAWQCRGEFLYIHTRPTPFGWVDVTSTSSTPCSPDDLTRAVLDVLERAVAEAPDDERLRADVAVCCTRPGGGAVLVVAEELEPFVVRHGPEFITKPRWG